MEEYYREQEEMEKRRADFANYKKEFEETGTIHTFDMSHESYLPWRAGWVSRGQIIDGLFTEEEAEQIRSCPKDSILPKELRDGLSIYKNIAEMEEETETS